VANPFARGTRSPSATIETRGVAGGSNLPCGTRFHSGTIEVPIRLVNEHQAINFRSSGSSNGLTAAQRGFWTSTSAAPVLRYSDSEVGRPPGSPFSRARIWENGIPSGGWPTLLCAAPEFSQARLKPAGCRTLRSVKGSGFDVALLNLQLLLLRLAPSQNAPNASQRSYAHSLRVLAFRRIACYRRSWLN
jgi:hypothetical protein